MAQAKYYRNESFFFPPSLEGDELFSHRGHIFGESYYTATSTSISDNVISSEYGLNLRNEWSTEQWAAVAWAAGGWNCFGKQLLAFILSLGGERRQS